MTIKKLKPIQRLPKNLRGHPVLQVLETLARFVVRLRALPPYATPEAIYFHFLRGQLVYIGQSVEARRRTQCHRSVKDFDEVYCLPVSPDGQRHFDLIERALIRYFEPRDNKSPFRMSADDLEVVNEILAGYGLTPGKVKATIERENAPAFVASQVERLWLKTNDRAHRALLLIANDSEPVSEHDGAWPAYCSMAKTIAYIDSVAHKECRARSPIFVGGSSGDRLFSMDPAMAAAFIECAARAEAA